MSGQKVERFKKGISSYPAAQRHGYIWVWPGDEKLADTDLIPDLTGPEVTTGRLAAGCLISM